MGKVKEKSFGFGKTSPTTSKKQSFSLQHGYKNITSSSNKKRNNLFN
jgi:hypothetical protein